LRRPLILEIRLRSRYGIPDHKCASGYAEPQGQNTAAILEVNDHAGLTFLRKWIPNP